MCFSECYGADIRTGLFILLIEDDCIEVCNLGTSE